MKMAAKMMLLNQGKGVERGQAYPQMDGWAEHQRTQRAAGYKPANRPAGGYSGGDELKPLDMEGAEEWGAVMDNADGTHGAHWTMDQVRQLMAQRGISCPLPAFYAALNAVYSDYVGVAKKHGVGGSMDYYVDMALAWLEDTDAVPDKAAAYWQHIVKH